MVLLSIKHVFKLTPTGALKKVIFGSDRKGDILCPNQHVPFRAILGAVRRAATILIGLRIRKVGLFSAWRICKNRTFLGPRKKKILENLKHTLNWNITNVLQFILSWCKKKLCIVIDLNK